MDPNPIYTPPMEMPSIVKTKLGESTSVPSPKTSAVEYRIFGRIPELFSEIGYALRNPGSAQDRYEKHFKKK